MTDDEIVRRGERAKRLLQDIKEFGVLDSMTLKTTQRISKSTHDARAEREYLCIKLTVIDEFERELTRAINGGKSAESRLAKILKVI